MSETEDQTNKEEALVLETATDAPVEVAPEVSGEVSAEVPPETLADLSSTDVPRAEDFVPVEDELGRTYATGKRKNAIARVWLKEGSGQITVNRKAGNEYFRRIVLNRIINAPFDVAQCQNQFDAVCTVRGGGLSGQAGALRHGISKALALRSFEMRKLLKAQSFLTRDSRVVERKKYGRRKARRSFQFSKR